MSEVTRAELNGLVHGVYPETANPVLRHLQEAVRTIATALFAGVPLDPKYVEGVAAELAEFDLTAERRRIAVLVAEAVDIVMSARSKADADAKLKEWIAGLVETAPRLEPARDTANDQAPEKTADPGGQPRTVSEPGQQA